MVLLSFNPYQWLEERIKFGVKEGFGNISQALSLLGSPHQKYLSTLIAGTNGKGYTTSLSSQLLTQSQLKVGWFVSPHMVNVRERIRIGDEVISNDEFTQIVEELAETCSEIPLTYFEALTVIAAIYFSRQSVDVALFEVGLGGRLDSTNIHDAQFSVITSIGLDHAEFLGEDLVQILREKAGVLRPGQESWVQLTQSELRKVIPEIIQETGASLQLMELTHLNQPQGHFKRNQELALQLCGAICKYLGREFKFQMGDEQVQAHRWAGRQQLIHDSRWGSLYTKILIDGAHNPESFDELLLSLNEIPPGDIVLGLMGDKALDQIFSRVLELESRGWNILFTHGNFPRFAKSDDLVRLYPGNSSSVSIQSLIQAQPNSQLKGGSLVLSGSLYFMAEYIQACAYDVPEFKWFQQFEYSSNEMIGMPKT